MQTNSMNAGCIGILAKQLLNHPGHGKVMGITSGGIFVKTAGERILFITSQITPGPITISVKILPHEKNPLIHGALVEYSSKILSIPVMHLSIDLRQAEVWFPPLRPKVLKTIRERNSHLSAIIQGLIKSGRKATYLSSLKEIISAGSKTIKMRSGIANQMKDWRTLQGAMNDLDVIEVGKVLKSFLGNGPGLTPAGDDFVWGFLLILNRWQDVLCPGLDVKSLNKMITKAAEKHTTSLSLTIIEAATRGWADARMMEVMDSLFALGLSARECVDHILAYGSSSGMDALAGMVVGGKF